MQPLSNWSFFGGGEKSNHPIPHPKANQLQEVNQLHEADCKEVGFWMASVDVLFFFGITR